MDEYGSYRNNESDWFELREHLKDHGSIVFPYSYDGDGQMIIHIDSTYTKLGITPFGGNPKGRYYVGIDGRGCGHFAPKHTEASYFEEKLKLGKGDADGLAELWGELFKPGE